MTVADETWLSQPVQDGGLSSLSSSARSRRENGVQFSTRIRNLAATWGCIQCRVKLRPHLTGRYLFCSDTCRDAALIAEQKRRGPRR